MSVKVRSFAAEDPGISLELISFVGVGLPISPDVERASGVLDLEGLWDTGATGCSITASVAKKINAPVINRVAVSGVHGSQYCNQYFVSMFLPNEIFIHELLVTELAENIGCDVLIGMDIISLGDFSTSTLGGKTSFTFRIPSCQKQDFTKYWPKDTTPCVCGSGNMFKNCCKRLIQNSIG
jgi:hypothetical protein